MLAHVLLPIVFSLVSEAPTAESSSADDAALVQAVSKNEPWLAQARQEGAVRSLCFTFGKRRMRSDDFWTPIDEPLSLGLEIASESAGSAVGFEAGLSFARQQENATVPGFPTINIEGQWIEFYGGLHKSFGAPDAPVRPYVGAGLTYIAVRVDGSLSGGASTDDTDGSLGIYVHGGVAFSVSQNFQLGVDARFVGGTKVSPFGADSDVDYTQLSVFIGFSL